MSMRQLLILLSFLLLVSCGPMWYVSTSNHDPVYQGVVVEVDSSTKIDTINSLFQLKRKLRTDFNFRWDFAQYAMNQPLSWYYNNPRLDGIWRPYNRFDVWFNSHQFWTDWAWDYPWYGWSHPWWVRHHRYYNWYYPHPQGWYGWNHYSYSWYNEPLIASNNNYSFVVGRRGSRYNDFLNGNSNIEQDTNRRRNNRVYPNPDNNAINEVIRWSRDNNIPNNTIYRPNNVNSNNNVVVPIKPNNNINNWNSKPRVPNNNFNNGRPPVNNFNSNPPVNINRGGNVGGSSRGSSSGGSSSSSVGRRGGN